MKILDKVRIPLAGHKPINVDLSCRHTTTTDFMIKGIPYIRRMIPREKLFISVSAFARLASMPLPTFGDANLNLRAFFVPYRMVFPGWTDFMADTPHAFASGSTPSLITNVRYTTASLLEQLFLSDNTYAQYVDPSNYAPGTDMETVSDFTDVDYDAGNTPPETISYYKFTPRGRALFTILNQLGYKLFFNYNVPTVQYNILDFLCYCKVCLDYYYPSAYYSEVQRTAVDSILRRDSNIMLLGFNDLKTLADFVTLPVCYANDYFTAAFDNPSGPNTVGSPITLNDTSVSSTISHGAVINFQNTSPYAGSPNGTPTIVGMSSSGQVGATAVNFSEYLFNSLRRLTDYLKRNQLAGAKSAERLLARFGVSMSNDEIGVSTYLGSHHIPLVVADVMSTADTSNGSNGLALGDYAGKGFLTGDNGHFKCESDEDFGLFIIVSSIVPKVGYYQGYDYHNIHSTKLDFYTSEFDGLGCRAIERGELYTSLSKNTINQQLMRKVFGFTPQYAEYKIPYDRLTGDFNCRSLSSAGFTSESWHLFRKYVPNGDDYNGVVHNRNFVIGSDYEQYLRIFYNELSDADHFVLNYLFSVKSSLPVKPLYDSYEFEHDDNGDLTIEANGKKLN